MAALSGPVITNDDTLHQRTAGQGGGDGIEVALVLAIVLPRQRNACQANRRQAGHGGEHQPGDDHVEADVGQDRPVGAVILLQQCVMIDIGEDEIAGDVVIEIDKRQHRCKNSGISAKMKMPIINTLLSCCRKPSDAAAPRRQFRGYLFVDDLFFNPAQLQSAAGWHSKHAKRLSAMIRRGNRIVQCRNTSHDLPIVRRERKRQA